MNRKEVTPVRTVVYRGGTSKGLFLRENDLPADPAIRDRVILSMFGSPDPRQIDGLGGAEVLTSKLAIVGPPSIEGADVDYVFGQVDIDHPYISYSGLCGNISCGVGPFAIEEGFVRAKEPITRVRIHNRNTHQIFVMEVPVKDGAVTIEGNHVIPGVPGTGAKLTLDMAGTMGSYGKGLLPTGNVRDTLTVPGVGTIEGSLIDAVNPCFFIHASALDLHGDEVKKTDFTPGKLEALELIRKEVFAALDKPYNPLDAVPFVDFVAPPMDYTNHLTGETIYKEDVSFLARLFFLKQIHQTYSGSISCCTGAAAVIPGTVVNEVCRRDESRPDVYIGHPAGVMAVEAICDMSNGKPVITRATYTRTARRIMEGYCFIPNRFFEEA